MMVIFVSQCEKKALNRTRRVLDAFADRIGDNTWQTVITQEGLQAVKKLLRKTASKNTAVSCHWIRSRARSDLLWVVGKKDKFNFNGVVPVNTTKRDILLNDWENNWHYASSIQIVATLAALFHDVGKSTIGFQQKLREKPGYGDPYRHEWISLQLFQCIVYDCSTDAEWFDRLLNIDSWLANHSLDKALQNANKDKVNIAEMPPLAQWVAWLIVTHHRLPPYKEVFYKSKAVEKLKKSTTYIKSNIDNYYERALGAFDYWVKNPKTLDQAPVGFSDNFWCSKQLVVHSREWQKHIKRWARKAKQDVTLNTLSDEARASNESISDTFLLYLSRLSLMVGDHNYSSLKPEDKRCVKGEKTFGNLAANTNRETNETKQALDEHLIGVAGFTADFAYKLPTIASFLPSITNQQSLSQSTKIDRFKWQNKSFNEARLHQEDSEQHGFFGVNMASTGCGKTIGNARIMYALANPDKGARFTIALGLRVLTLQTGQSFRKDLQLTNQQLAILVGGQANKKLFEMNQSKNSDEPEGISNEVEQLFGHTFGSESSEELLSEVVDAEIDYSDYDALNLGTVVESAKARDLLFAPIVTCTVDHIIQASECKRGGKYIAPMLRLLSSDLILDEPDDFDQADLPALTRLVHLAGLFGSRVLLSSATLTPDLVTGLFNAYYAGRKLYNRSQNKPEPKTVCAWFDEHEKNIMSAVCSETDGYFEKHADFIKKRESYLAKQSVRRKAEILPLDLIYCREKSDNFYADLGGKIIDGAIQLHNKYHQEDPGSKKNVSVGLVRIANISNITQIAMRLFDNVKVMDNVHIHLACYHAKQVLVLRNSLENKLDRILKRDQDKPELLFLHSEITEALAQSTAKNHIFIVLATPVAEVGRDHDYDWAIVEPSSMRSIIQLAGRVWRHRPQKVADVSNMLILQYNIRKYTKNSGNPVFTKPGFETKQFKTNTYDVSQLITEQQLDVIDARPRIVKPPYTDVRTLSDLEHTVMADLLNNGKLNYVNAYWNEVATANRLHTHLQQISPFRQSTPQEDWLLIPNNELDNGFEVYYAYDVKDNKLANATLQNLIKPLDFSFSHPSISPWLNTSLIDALVDLKQYEESDSLRYLAAKYSSVSLEESQNGWGFNEFLGFVKN